MFKSLFICKREGPNIKPMVPFLCTRVKGPDKDDHKMLLIMIKYNQETQYYNLILKINNMTMADWYAHADFEVHADMKSHMGGVLTMGKGTI